MENIQITDLVLPYGMKIPPDLGAHARSFNLLRNLGDDFKVRTVGYGPDAGIDSVDDRFERRVVSKRNSEILLERLLESLNDRMPSGYIATALLCSRDRAYKAALRDCARQSDVLMAEFPYQFSLIDRNMFGGKVLIYNAHNCEHLLYKNIISDTFFGNLAKWFIYNLENQACKRSDIVLACSEPDKDRICRLYGVCGEKVCVVPNGADTEHTVPASIDEKSALKNRFGLSGKPMALFIGSRYQLNLESVNFIVNTLAPSLREWVFIIAGSVVRSFFNDASKIDYSDFFAIGREDRKVSGYGWYPVERFSEGVHARWTRGRFGFHVHDQVSGIYLRTVSKRPVEAEVYVNGGCAGHVVIGGRGRLTEVSFETVKDPVVDIRLERCRKPLFDPRHLGVAVDKMGCIKLGEKCPIDISGIKSRAFSVLGIENVIFLDDLDDDTKKTVLKASDIALNPMFYGSGTNLKMFEYMAAGLPVVTTPVGARGIDMRNMKDAIICEADEFPRHVSMLGADPVLYEDIRKNARRLVEDAYDWRVISSGLSGIIKGSVKK